jgi:uncharacterized protein YigE (DUF2233 family)
MFMSAPYNILLLFSAFYGLQFILSMALPSITTGGAKRFAPMPKLSIQVCRVDPATKDVRLWQEESPRLPAEAAQGYPFIRSIQWCPYIICSP